MGKRLAGPPLQLLDWGAGPMYVFAHVPLRRLVRIRAGSDVVRSSGQTNDFLLLVAYCF